MLIVAGTITFDPTKSAELQAAFDTMRVATLEEPGCLAYQAWADRKDPGTVFLFEKWKSQEALTTHFQTPHMAAFGAALGSCGITGMDVKKYEISAEGSVP
ncbi:MAG: antibiotic biosynthesis monooxygenase [Deltaproteobacteria bacterium]|nr:antibiotic biosynthesis monooxygenase [Deltaproteobacteria bacterium]